MSVFRRIVLLTALSFLSLPTLCFAQVTTANEVTITARGTGTTAELARKDALMNAVYQAVGSYIDSETLLANDQLIKEQVLQASGSYVHRYDVVMEPKQREDQLWEISIQAVIRGGQVQERLKAIKIQQAGIVTKDQVAEAISKIENAKQGAQILESQFEGLLPKLLVARLIDKEGKASQQVSPHVQILNDGRLSCTWYVEIYFDTKTYYEKVVPPLDQILSAISAHSGGPVQSECQPHVPSQSRTPTSIHLTGYPCYGERKWRGATPTPPKGDQPHVYFLLSTGRSATGGTERFQWYLLEGAEYLKAMTAAAPWWGVILNVDLLAEDGGVVWKEAMKPWTKCLIQHGNRVEEQSRIPYHLVPLELEGSLYSNAVFSPTFGATSNYSGDKAPHYGSYIREHGSPTDYNGHGDTILKSFTTILDPEDLQRIKQVRFHFSDGATLTP